MTDDLLEPDVPPEGEPGDSVEYPEAEPDEAEPADDPGLGPSEHFGLRPPD